MRELKFRAWNKRAKVYDEYFELSPKWTQNGDQIIDNKAFIIEQYTGLKDKNGKEIYEGDIIHRRTLPKVNVFRNSVIRFDEESVGFIATSTRNGARTLFNGHTCDEIEVIGNIHENPELCGEEDYEED